MNDGQWHHLSSTLPETGHWRIGYSGEGKWDPEWTSEYFQGSIDESRLAYQSRGEDWLRLDYESQKPGSTVLIVEKDPSPQSLVAVARPTRSPNTPDDTGFPIRGNPTPTPIPFTSRSRNFPRWPRP